MNLLLTSEIAEHTKAKKEKLKKKLNTPKLSSVDNL